jgi:hypothetical protein
VSVTLLPRVTPGMEPDAHWIGGWVGLRAGLDTEGRGQIPCIYRESKPGRPVSPNQTVTELPNYLL